MNIVILAAGSSKRMYSDIPKVLHLLGGQPLINYVVNTARMLSPNRIIIVVGHDRKFIESVVSAEDIFFVNQNNPLGTGHALLQALPFLNPNYLTLVLNGDVPLIKANTLLKLVSCAMNAGGPYGYGYAILTFQPQDTTGYGRIIRNKNGKVCAIVEHSDANLVQKNILEVNSGIVAIPTIPLTTWLNNLKKCNAQGEFYLTDLVSYAINDTVPVVTYLVKDTNEVRGVNNRIQLAELERIYQINQVNLLLNNSSVSVYDPKRVDIRGKLICGRDVKIDVNVIFEGQVELGDGVYVGPNCVLRNVTIGSQTHINAFSYLEETHIGSKSIIGPYARLRQGVQLADNVKVGNFVEVKQTYIGNNTKINHMSYIGNAYIGNEVNIGAGMITCNYDGTNKHFTSIEDNVFVGSDSQLVAPITIGKGSTVGAGTTVWRNVGTNELVLNNKTQITRQSNSHKKNNS